MSPKARRDYTPQHRAEAVVVAQISDEPIRQVARNLGIAESNPDQAWVGDISVPQQRRERWE